VLLTLDLGCRYLFVRTPWHPVYDRVYVAFFGIAAESVIIDTDHWRHYFLLLGVLWGLMAPPPCATGGIWRTSTGFTRPALARARSAA
jgi:hypothetical protein